MSRSFLFTQNTLFCQFQDDKEKKRLEQLEKKKELQRLAEEEMSSLKGAKAPSAKVTRAEIQSNMARLEAEGELFMVC